MTNEELVERIQAGEKDLIPILWEQVERFVSQQAGMRARQLQGYGGVSEDDLYQSGFIGLLDAVQSYDAGQGMSFIGWLAFHLKSAFRDAIGRQTDAITRATSLDAPLQGEDGGTLADIVANPIDDCEAVEGDIYHEQLRNKLDWALDSIPAQESEILRSRFYRGLTLEQTGKQQGVPPYTARKRERDGLRKMRHPRITRELQQFIEENTPYFMRVGVTRFQNTHSSATEEIVLLRERMQGG